MDVVFLIGFGILGGAINTLSGGGSMITIGALMVLGMPANVANATNRIPVFFQSAVGVGGYVRSGLLEVSNARFSVPWIVLGAIGGSLVAGTMSNKYFEPVLIACMLGVAVHMLFGGGPKVRDDQSSTGQKAPSWVAIFGLIFAGFYGGLVQAGVGLILLTVLSGIMQIQLVQANGLKLVVVNIMTIVSLIIFAWQGLLDIIPGLLMAIGTMIGALIGVRISLSRGERWIRILSVSMAIATILYAAFR